MTVRAWFRIQRAALWARDAGTACDLDRIATAVTVGEWPQAGEWVRVGSFVWVESGSSYVERQRLLVVIREEMAAATRRLLYTRDITT